MKCSVHDPEVMGSNLSRSNMGCDIFVKVGLERKNFAYYIKEMTDTRHCNEDITFLFSQHRKSTAVRASGYQYVFVSYTVNYLFIQFTFFKHPLLKKH